MKTTLRTFAAAVAVTAGVAAMSAAPAIAADPTSASTTDKAGDDDAGPQASKAIRASSDILKAAVDTAGTKTVATITLAGPVIKDASTYSGYTLTGQLSGASKEALVLRTVFNSGKSTSSVSLSGSTKTCAVKATTKGKVVKLTMPDSCLPSGSYTLSSIDFAASAQGETFSQDSATISGAKVSIK